MLNRTEHKHEHVAFCMHTSQDNIYKLQMRNIIIHVYFKEIADEFMNNVHFIWYT